VFIRIQGVQHYLWRAVDQDVLALDILVRQESALGTQLDRRRWLFLTGARRTDVIAAVFGLRNCQPRCVNSQAAMPTFKLLEVAFGT
jgi:hypothetical protein